MTDQNTTGDGDASAATLDRNVQLDESLLARIRRANAQSLATGQTPAERIEGSNAEIAEQNAEQARQNTLWRKFLFWSVYGIVMVVALLAAAVILIYLITNGEDASPAVISTWIGASVVQVIGLLLVITRHLFPSNTPPG